MSKKKKGSRLKKHANRPKNTERVSAKRSRYPLLAMIAGGVLVIAGIYFVYQGEKTPQGSPQIKVVKKENLNLREKRPTLSPQMFSGKVRMAYEIAREIPEVLDRLYCYCRCRENFGHKNLLSCYVDTHAST